MKGICNSRIAVSGGLVKETLFNVLHFEHFNLCWLSFDPRDGLAGLIGTHPKSGCFEGSGFFFLFFFKLKTVILYAAPTNGLLTMIKNGR